mgnify:CR=1 FL=1
MKEKVYPLDYPKTPRHIWEHFYQFTQIPRPSKQEGKIRQYIIDQATLCGHRYQSDDAGNVVVYVPATGDVQQQETVIIQNHVDMVTVKTDDKSHDFSKDPLQLCVYDGWLSADRTTLGADNGIGCAAALALMTDLSVAHPPLELLFTMDEETGLGGALRLDSSLLTGMRMLNLDTEDWGEIFVGCAGARGWQMSRDVQRETVPEKHKGYRLVLNGLTGGHSGIQIHQQLGSATKLIAQWLLKANSLGVRIHSLRSGVAHNVLSRQAEVTFTCPESTSQDLQQLQERLLESWHSFLPDADKNVYFEMVETDIDSVLTTPCQEQLIQLLSIFPHGAQSYSLAQPADLVDLSINLAIVRIEEDGFLLESSLRFFNRDQAQALIDNVLSIAELFDLSVKDTLSYPGWAPDFDSPLLAKVKDLHCSLFGKTPAVKAIHAGLECGILKSKMAEVDIISFGPTIRGAHSPSERLEIATVEPFWKLLTGLLKVM